MEVLLGSLMGVLFRLIGKTELFMKTAVTETQKTFGIFLKKKILLICSLQAPCFNRQCVTTENFFLKKQFSLGF